jgi:polar amino acid transport system substrate-binding protein
VLVRNHFSVVSPGTERLIIGFARKSLLEKARSRPDLVRQVVRKFRHEGPLPTYRAVMSRLDAPQPLGYSCAGVVEMVGQDVTEFAPQDRVACAGAGYANHAEFVAVPENLVTRIPEGVALEHAAFATIGAIALQGLRVAQPTLGEIAVVIGLGLIGQLAVQLLRANGCRVYGIDIDPLRVRQAVEQGAEWASAPDAVTGLPEATGGYGADFALVTASSDTSAPIQLAAELCRQKGRVAVIGQTAMELDRRSFYEKELELRMSMSYGPGRYDRSYEEVGLDYPLPYVRWTENRNLQAFLALLASGALQPARLEAELLPFEEALSGYEELLKGERRSLALVFRYDAERPFTSRTLELPTARAAKTREEVGVAFLGAGTYAKGVLLPALERSTHARRVALVTATGPSARRTAERFGFGSCGTDPAALFSDKTVDLVFVATRHDTHAPLAEAALRAGKSVWLEKPVGVTHDQVNSVAEAAATTGGFLTVGFNRRFSPHARAVRLAFQARNGPLAIHYRVAAGTPPVGSWQTDPREGAGRIVGEACHFVDLCAYLVGAPPHTVFARALGRDPEVDDSVVAILGFPDGSTATVEYLARTSPDLPKERFEASAEGRTAQCDNYRVTRISGAKDVKTWNQDKGQATAVAEVIEAVRAGHPSPFSLEELVGVSRATLALLESARTGSPVSVPPWGPAGAGE